MIASMQQQGRLMISSVNREGRSPIRDYDGNIVCWEFDLVPTMDFTAKVSDPTQDERMALEIAITPGHRSGIHVLLERLAQIKPIGSSEAKQATVVSYLTYDLVQDGVSEFVVSELCAEQRRKPVYELTDRFFPDSGDFLASANRRMKSYKAALQAIIDKEEENKQQH